MILTCEACNTRYLVKPMSIGPEGRTVKCAKCAHRWTQMPEGAAPEDVIQEPPEKVDDIPKGSALPTVAEEKKVSAVLKATVISLLFIALVVSFLLNYQPITQKFPAAMAVYETLGIKNTQGLHLTKINLTNLPGVNEGERPLYVLEGQLVNSSDSVRTLPNLRINVMDQSDKVLHSLMLKSSGESINPDEPFDFYNKLPILSRRSYYVTIDIGNGLELFLR